MRGRAPRFCSKAHRQRAYESRRGERTLDELGVNAKLQRQMSQVGRSKEVLDRFAAMGGAADVGGAAARLVEALGPQFRLSSGAADLAASLAKSGGVGQALSAAEKLASTAGVTGLNDLAAARIAGSSLNFPDAWKKVGETASILGVGKVGEGIVESASILGVGRVAGSSINFLDAGRVAGAAMTFDHAFASKVVGASVGFDWIGPSVGSPRMTEAMTALSDHIGTQAGIREHLMAFTAGHGVSHEMAEKFRAMTVGAGVLPPSMAAFTGPSPQVLEALSGTYMTLFEDGALTSAADLVQRTVAASWMEPMQSDVARALERITDELEVDLDEEVDVEEAPNATAAVCLALITYLALLRSQDVTAEMLGKVIGDLGAMMGLGLDASYWAIEGAPPRVKAVLAISSVVSLFGQALIVWHLLRGRDDD
jgi:hypothetical protein